MAFIFWLCVFLIIWVYAGYPALLWLLHRFSRGRPVTQGDIEPNVTLIVSAYNEGKIIRRKLENCLALDYPRRCLDIVVVSDASADDTDQIVSEYEAQGVRLLRMHERGGKTVGLNFTVPRAYGDIVIFSDANAMYDREVVRKLARNFADANVGCVTGESRYTLEGASQSAQSENLYWRYEIALKKMETHLGSLVGGDGAIYAIRKNLYRPMQPADLSDFINPLQITAQGYRNVYEPEAFSYEEGAENEELEFGRKVRIVTRAWRGLWRVRKVLNPFKFGFFAVQVISHKLLRWLVPVFMLGALGANLLLLLSGEPAFYVFTAVIQVIFYLLALLGWRQARPGGAIPRALYVPYFFCLVNYASLQGIWNYYRGKTFTTWQTVRESQA